MPPYNSPNQLQKNRVIGQAAEQVGNRIVLILVDIFKFTLDFIKQMLSMISGK